MFERVKHKKPNRLLIGGRGETLESITVAPDSVAVTGGLAIIVRLLVGGGVVVFVASLRVDVKNVLRRGQDGIGWCGWSV